MLLTRLLTAAVALPLLVVLVCFAPTWLFSLVVLALVAVGLHEYFAMAAPSAAATRRGGLAGGLCLAAAMLSHRPELWGGVLSALVIGALVATLAAGSGELRSGANDAASVLLGVLYVAFLLPHIAWVHSGGHGRRWVLFILVVSMAGDTASYFGGRFFGRHQLAPHVSPAKTVEGAVAGMLGSVAGGGVGWLAFFHVLPLGELLALGVVLGALAQLGDLAESVLKRAFGAKDSGRVIPGHGGLLDRTDSLVFPAVFVYYYRAWSAVAGAGGGG